MKQSKVLSCFKDKIKNLVKEEKQELEQSAKKRGFNKIKHIK